MCACEGVSACECGCMLGGERGGGVGGSGPGRICKNIPDPMPDPMPDPVPDPRQRLGGGFLLFENEAFVDFQIGNEAVGQTQRKLSILKRGTSVYITRPKASLGFEPWGKFRGNCRF